MTNRNIVNCQRVVTKKIQSHIILHLGKGLYWRKWALYMTSKKHQMYKLASKFDDIF